MMALITCPECNGQVSDKPPSALTVGVLSPCRSRSKMLKERL